MVTSLLQVAAVGALLAPLAVVTRLAGAISRNRLETDRAATALAQLGIHECPLAVERLGGGRSNAVYRIRFPARTVVLKQALSEGTLLALAARWVGPQPYGEVSASARIHREVRALEALHAAGVRVPRVIAANGDAGLILVEHVQGETLPCVIELARLAGRDELAASRIRAYAAAVRAAHAAGIALTDAHPGNALVDGAGNVTLIDLEFAEMAADLGDRFADRCVFDLAYAAQYFHADERRVFVAAAGVVKSDLAIASARFAGFAPLFELELRRQRRTIGDVSVELPAAAARSAA